MNRYVLNRPRGGLHDQLCSIGDCTSYCLRYGRQLFIDTRFSGLHDNFWTYFQTVGHESLFNLELDYAAFDQMTSFPTEIQGRISTLKGQLVDGDFYISDSQTRSPLSFSFESSYNAEILVHEQGRLGNRSPSAIYFLGFVTLSNWLRDYVITQLSNLPSEYLAIHVRHTDYKTTDIQEKLTVMLRSIPSGLDILVCSDSELVFEIARDVFGRSRVLRLSSQVSIDGEPLHSSPAKGSQRILNAEVFADLFGLVKAKYQVYLPVTCELNDGRILNIHSGFSMLADGISKNRVLTKQLLGQPISTH